MCHPQWLAPSPAIPGYPRNKTWTWGAVQLQTPHEAERSRKANVFHQPPRDDEEAWRKPCTNYRDGSKPAKNQKDSKMRQELSKPIVGELLRSVRRKVRAICKIPTQRPSIRSTQSRSARTFDPSKRVRPLRLLDFLRAGLKINCPAASAVGNSAENLSQRCNPGMF